ncbi:MAG TPA: TIGR02391 family protein [Thermoanaerobaculia bacterium]
MSFKRTAPAPSSVTALARSWQSAFRRLNEKHRSRRLSRSSCLCSGDVAFSRCISPSVRSQLARDPSAVAVPPNAQKGYRFVFAGGVLAIRNPRGHEYDVTDDPDTCLDHLSFVSMLLRRFAQAGFA